MWTHASNSEHAVRKSREGTAKWLVWTLALRRGCASSFAERSHGLLCELSNVWPRGKHAGRYCLRSGLTISWKKCVRSWPLHTTPYERIFVSLLYEINEVEACCISRRRSSLLFQPAKFVGKSAKWSRKYTGPFRITKELAPVTMLLPTHNKRRTFVAHVDKLKRSFEVEIWVPSSR